MMSWLWHFPWNSYMQDSVKSVIVCEFWIIMSAISTFFNCFAPQIQFCWDCLLAWDNAVNYCSCTNTSLHVFHEIFTQHLLSLNNSMLYMCICLTWSHMNFKEICTFLIFCVLFTFCTLFTCFLNGT